MNCDILCNFTCKITVKLSKYHYILSNFRFRNLTIANNKSAKTQEDKFLLYSFPISVSNFQFFCENAGVQYFIESIEFHLIQDDYWANTFKKITVWRKLFKNNRIERWNENIQTWKILMSKFLSKNGCNLKMHLDFQKLLLNNSILLHSGLNPA